MGLNLQLNLFGYQQSISQKIRKNERDNLDTGVVPAKITLTPNLVRDINKEKIINEQSKNYKNELNIPNI